MEELSTKSLAKIYSESLLKASLEYCADIVQIATFYKDTPLDNQRAIKSFKDKISKVNDHYNNALKEALLEFNKAILDKSDGESND